MGAPGEPKGQCCPFLHIWTTLSLNQESVLKQKTAPEFSKVWSPDPTHVWRAAEPWAPLQTHWVRVRPRDLIFNQCSEQSRLKFRNHWPVWWEQLLELRLELELIILKCPQSQMCLASHWHIYPCPPRRPSGPTLPTFSDLNELGEFSISARGFSHRGGSKVPSHLK